MTFEIQANYVPRVLTALRADEQATISTELVTVKTSKHLVYNVEFDVVVLNVVLALLFIMDL